MKNDVERIKAQTERELVALARRRGYKDPVWWAKMIMEGRHRKSKNAKLITVGGKRV
jgi:hypothetical protein